MDCSRPAISPQFALVAGAVLAWNVGDWLAVRADPTSVDRAIYALLTSATLVGLMLWVATGRFYTYAAEGRRVGLGEQPGWYAHGAARFASRNEMPSRFVAFHEGQAAVLEFHMRPDQRVFVDPRLEVTPRPALEQYYELARAMAARKHDWARLVPQSSEPLGLLIDHRSHHRSHHALAGTLLGDERWRCVWFDEVAGVYVPSTATQLINEYGIDFGAQYFAPGDGRTISVGDFIGRIGRG